MGCSGGRWMTAYVLTPSSVAIPPAVGNQKATVARRGCKRESRQNLDPVTGRESVDIRLSSSLYLDRGGSVLASIHWSEVDHRLLAVNVYPGVFSRDFGAWVNIDQNLSFQFGISHRLALGLGLGMAVDN